MTDLVLSQMRILRALGVFGALFAGGACAPTPAFRTPVGVLDDAGADVPHVELPPDASAPQAQAADLGPPPMDAPLPVDARPPPDTAPDRPVSADLPVVPSDMSVEALAPKTALFVVGNTTLESSDAKIRMHLEGKGFTVKVVKTDAAATSANGTDLVVLSASNSAGTLAGKYTMVAVPTIVLEPAVYDDMKMTANAANSGETPDGTQIVVSTAHPIVNGLPVGMPAVVATAATPLAWGEVMAGAGIATQVGSTIKFTVFAYDAGAPMAGGLNAPARRVGLFVSTGSADRLNATGWQIFDNAVDWATR